MLEKRKENKNTYIQTKLYTWNRSAVMLSPNAFTLAHIVEC